MERFKFKTEKNHNKNLKNTFQIFVRKYQILLETEIVSVLGFPSNKDFSFHGNPEIFQSNFIPDFLKNVKTKKTILDFRFTIFSFKAGNFK